MRLLPVLRIRGGQFWIPQVTHSVGMRPGDGPSRAMPHGHLSAADENEKYGRFGPPLQPQSTLTTWKSGLFSPGRHDQTTCAFSRMFETRNDLVFDSFRVAEISTRSPDLALVVLVVRVELARLHDDLAVERMLDPPLDQHRHRLVHLVADHAADERLDQRLAAAPLPCSPSSPVARSCLPLVALAPAAACAFWWISVRTRAIPRRTVFSFELSVSCWVAACMRRPNCSFSSASSSVCSSAGRLARERLLRFRSSSCRFPIPVSRRSGGARTSS